MGRFTIYSTNATLPSEGPNVRGNLDFDTGEAAKWQAAKGLGRAGQETALAIHQMQGEAELAQVMATNKEAMTRMLIGFEQNPDPESYDKIFADTFTSEVEKRQVKNGWARRRYQNMLPGYRANMEATVYAVKRKRTLDNFDSALRLKETDAIESGMLGNYGRLLDTAVKAGFISEDEAQSDMKRVGRLSQRREVERVVLGPNPEAMLKYKTYDELHQQYSLLTPGDFADLRAMAVGQKRNLEASTDELSPELVNDTFLKAQTLGVPEFRDMLKQTVGISPEQQWKLLKIFTQAQGDWQDSGDNPFVVTQNQGSKAQALIDIHLRQLKTQRDLIKRWTENETINWSIADYLALTQQLNAYTEPQSSGKYSRTHPVARRYFDALTALYTGKDEEITDRKAWADAYMALDEAFSDSEIWKNADKRDAAYNQIAKTQKETKAKTLLGMYSRLAVPGWGAYSIAKGWLEGKAAETTPESQSLDQVLASSDIPDALRTRVEALRATYPDEILLTIDELKPYIRGLE